MGRKNKWISPVHLGKQELKPANATEQHQLECNDRHQLALSQNSTIRNTGPKGRRHYQLGASDGANWTNAKER